jgi:ATP-dependent Zn protease
VALAGMAAEEVLVGDRSVGAGGTKGSDLNEATMLASRMIESYGFGKNLRFMRPARWIDESYTPPSEIWPEIDQILQKEYRSARDMLAKNREQVAKLAAELYLDKRILIERDKIQPAKSARH